MSGSKVVTAVGQVATGLDTLAATDLAGLADAQLRQELLELTTVANRVHAEMIRRVDAFDRRGLAGPDGFGTAKTWLQGWCRLSGVVAHRLVKAARLLRSLPKLAEVTQSGHVSGEHVQQVVRLADQIGADRVVEVEATLADAAPVLDLSGFTLLTERVRAHVEPDGPDPAAGFDRRGVTLAPVAGMVNLRGQLDPEGGAALQTALDAIMTPPGPDDARTPAQRRADALVELARRPLAAGDLPTVAGQRPQVGVLLWPQTLSPKLLAELAAKQKDSFTAQRLRHFLTDTEPDHTDPTGVEAGGGLDVPDPDDTGVEAGGSGEADAAADPSGHRADDPPATSPQTTDVSLDDAATGADQPGWRTATAVFRPTWSDSGWADPPYLNWFGAISNHTAQRIACDADLFRIILDPHTGMPLDVGRTHRLVPHWIRKALHIRDRGCRWTGCTIPAEWTDSHHLDHWVDDGETTVERCLLLCRYHHVQVHERGWEIDLDPDTGEVHITRPGGVAYRIPHTRSTSWNGTATRAS